MIKILSFQAKTPYQLLIERRLREQNWQIMCVSEIDKALKLMTAEFVNLILIYVQDNFLAAQEILQTIKAEKIDSPTIVLTTDKSQMTTQFLSAGATEVICGQTSWPELWLRIKNLSQLQKREMRSAEEITIGTHYYQEGILLQAGQQIKLRQKENRILECLTKYQHKVLNRNELMRYVWVCPADYPSPDTIDVYIRRLRIKLGLNGKAIKTYRGFGYRWEPGA